MTKTKAITALLSIFISLPIWFFLLYRILEAVNASDLMWFLYGAYVPSVFLGALITKIAGEE